MISHARECLVFVEKGIIRYTIPLFFDFEKHLGRQIILERPAYKDKSLEVLKSILIPEARVKQPPLEPIDIRGFDLRTFKERRSCCG
jgi:hypothetical protein